MYALKGYENYINNLNQNEKEEFAKLAGGQAPKTLFITCSDSRICPNRITNTKEGELFVIRNAGNTIREKGSVQGDADVATLEFAVKVLNVSEIVVCGHTHCGAISGLLSGVDPQKLEYLDQYLKNLAPLKNLAFQKKLSIKESIEENVRMQIQNILSYDFVKEKVKKKELNIYGWVYSIESGQVELINKEEAYA